MGPELIKVNPLDTPLDIFIATLAILDKSEEEIALLLRYGLRFKPTPKGLNVYCLEENNGGVLTWFHRYRGTAWILSYKKAGFSRLLSLYCKGFLWKVPVKFNEWKHLLWVSLEIKKNPEILAAKKITNLGIDFSKFSNLKKF